MIVQLLARLGFETSKSYGNGLHSCGEDFDPGEQNTSVELSVVSVFGAIR